MVRNSDSYWANKFRNVNEENSILTFSLMVACDRLAETGLYPQKIGAEIYNEIYSHNKATYKSTKQMMLDIT